MNSTVFVHEFTAMASQCQVTLAGISREEALSLAGQAEAEVRRIERKYSRYREDSVVADINRMAGVSAVTCDEETLTLLDNAALLYAHSEGLFDITSGVLRRAWQFDSRVPPSTEALHAVLPLIGWHKVQREGTQVMLPEAGMEIDFGGFGKEYATDRAAALLRRAGVRSGHVNLGGDLHVLGPKPDGSPWMIGIRHPRQGTHPLATIPLSEGALATSGDYERYFIHEGTRYCHILNPKTGHPARAWQSISIVCPDTLSAGSLSTVAMLMEERALDFLRATGVSFLAVSREGKLYVNEENTAQSALA